MCSIFGFSKKFLPEMKIDPLNVMRHRGPDQDGFENFGSISMGHNRLSIVDISEKGRQPFYSRDARYVMIFNGEVYNYKELRKDYFITCTSSTDTEVILELFSKLGVECFKLLDGMFAIAILDRQKDILYLARDRAGQKPLYYSGVSEGFIFASELKFFYNVGNRFRKICKSGLVEYLIFGTVRAPNTIISDVKKLTPGAYLEVDFLNRNVSEQILFHNESNTDAVNESNEPLLDEVSAILEESVSLQLNADVEVGVLLSGGLDSSLIAAIAARKSRSTIKTFNVSFPDSGRYDESSYAKAVSQHIGSEHYELIAEKNLLSSISDLAKIYDEPISDSSMLPTYAVSKLVSSKIKVVLGGDGADELFGGYSSYRRVATLKKLRKFFTPARGGTISRLISEMSTQHRGMNTLKNVFSDKFNTMYWGAFFSAKEVKELVDVEPRDFIQSECRREFLDDNCLLEKLMNLDFSNYLVDDILIKTDRSSMANGLELRSPFLCNSLITTSKSVRVEHKVGEHSGKLILQDIAKRYLHSDFTYGRKQGFSVPLSDWLSKEDFLQGIRNDIMNSGIFRADKVLKYTSINYARSNPERLYALWFLSLWKVANSLKI